MSARTIPANTTPDAPAHPISAVADEAAKVLAGNVRFIRADDEGIAFRSLAEAGTWLRAASILDLTGI